MSRNKPVPPVTYSIELGQHVEHIDADAEVAAIAEDMGFSGTPNIGEAPITFHWEPDRDFGRSNHKVGGRYGLGDNSIDIYLRNAIEGRTPPVHEAIAHELQHRKDRKLGLTEVATTVVSSVAVGTVTGIEAYIALRSGIDGLAVYDYVKVATATGAAALTGLATGFITCAVLTNPMREVWPSEFSARHAQRRFEMGKYETLFDIQLVNQVNDTSDMIQGNT